MLNWLVTCMCVSVVCTHCLYIRVCRLPRSSTSSSPTETPSCPTQSLMTSCTTRSWGCSRSSGAYTPWVSGRGDMGEWAGLYLMEGIGRGRKVWCDCCITAFAMWVGGAVSGFCNVSGRGCVWLLQCDGSPCNDLSSLAWWLFQHFDAYATVIFP